MEVVHGSIKPGNTDSINYEDNPFYALFLLPHMSLNKVSLVLREKARTMLEVRKEVISFVNTHDNVLRLEMNMNELDALIEKWESFQENMLKCVPPYAFIQDIPICEGLVFSCYIVPLDNHPCISIVRRSQFSSLVSKNLDQKIPLSKYEIEDLSVDAWKNIRQRFHDVSTGVITDSMDPMIGKANTFIVSPDVKACNSADANLLASGCETAFYESALRKDPNYARAVKNSKKKSPYFRPTPAGKHYQSPDDEHYMYHPNEDLFNAKF